MNRPELLRSIPLFEGLEEQDVQELAAGLVERRLAPGQVVFQCGEPAASMFLVAQGLVHIYLPSAVAGAVELADLGPGKYFGEMALLDQQPRSASAQTRCETVLLELGRAELSAYLTRRPVAALAILRTLAERIRQTNALLSERAAVNPVVEFEKSLSWADRLADQVAALNGSWAFIAGLALFTGLWVVLNLPSVRFAWLLDPYPFQFFNLLLAVLVALQGPLIVMSQNRHVAKDRKEAETNFKVNLKNEMHIEAILSELREVRRQLAEATAPSGGSGPGQEPDKGAKPAPEPSKNTEKSACL